LGQRLSHSGADEILHGDADPETRARLAVMHALVPVAPAFVPDTRVRAIVHDDAELDTGPVDLDSRHALSVA
jgi:hypothetical protein